MVKVILERPYLGRGTFKVYAIEGGKKKDRKTFKSYNAAGRYAIKLQDYYQTPVKEI